MYHKMQELLFLFYFPSLQFHKKTESSSVLRHQGQ